MKKKQLLQIISAGFVASYSYSVDIHQLSSVDNFTNTNTGYRALPDESHPTMYRTLLNDSAFTGFSTDNPMLNIITNRMLSRRNAGELNGASFVMNYKFAQPLSVNKNSNVNFYFDSVNKPFKLELNINKEFGSSNISSVNCTQSQNHYSIPMSQFTYVRESISGVDIKLFANPNDSGSLAVLDRIEFGAEPVPEPISLLTMGSGLVAFIKRRRQKHS